MSIAETLAATTVSNVDLARYVQVPTDATVEGAVESMRSAGQTAACVGDEDLVGIFTERDVLQRVIGRPSTWGRPITEEMTTPVRTIRPGATVGDGLAVMIDWWVRNVPVLEEGGSLIGNLSYYTILATMADLLTDLVAGANEDQLDFIDFTGLPTSPPVSVRLDETVDFAAHHMRVRAIGSVLVTDDREDLVGVLTEFDLMMKIGCTHDDLAQIPIKDVMTANPVSLAMRSSIADAIAEMGRRQFSHVPLVGESGRPVGVASFRDVAGYLEAGLGALG